MNKTETSNLIQHIEQIADLGVYNTDLTTGCWTASDKFIEIFGMPKKAVYTVEEFQALIHPDDFNDVMNFFERCLAEKKDFNYEYRCQKPGGEVIHVLSRSKIQYADDGTPLEIIGIKQDITERKQNEIEMARLNAINKQKNEVLSLVAHDLRSPILQIEGVVNLLQDELGEGHEELLNMQKQACENSKTIISEIIETAELDEVQYKPEMVNTDLNDLVDQSVIRHQYMANQKSLTIKKQLCNRAVTKVNPKKLTRAIDNLLSNAIKFTTGNKSIELTTKNNDQYVMVRVKDEGIGIPEDYIPSLFKKFSKQVRRQGTHGESSTGLGLSIVKRIVELHNGSVQVRSKASQGTTFTIKLPKASGASN